MNDPTRLISVSLISLSLALSGSFAINYALQPVKDNSVVTPQTLGPGESLRRPVMSSRQSEPAGMMVAPLDSEPSSLHSWIPEKAGFDAREMIQHHDEATLAVWFPGLAFAPDWTWDVLITAADEPVDEFGNRLIHVAARSGNHPVVWVLMEHGADPDILNNFNEKAVDVVHCFDRRTRDAIVQCILRNHPHGLAMAIASFHAKDKQEGRYPNEFPEERENDLPSIGWSVFGRATPFRK